MYCVIQQVMRKKPDPYGEYREIRAYQNQWRLDESKPFTWAWERTGGRFERPHMEAYGITLHQSYREGGAVRKRQHSICTMSYYDIVEWSLYDCADRRIQAAADKLGTDPAELYELIEIKLEPLREHLEADFHQSAEYQAKQEHERIIADHMTAQNEFCRKYDVDKDEYNRCYDVFGVLRNKDYLEKIKAQHKARNRRYQESKRSTYERYTSGSYSIPTVSIYTEEETAILKKLYRSLTKTYHPDLNPDKDTTAEMQLLNRIKEQWGV